MAGAIKALEASKPDLLQIKRVVRRSLALANVLDLNPKYHRAITAFLENSDSEAPETDYEFHSQGIIDILKQLKDEFEKNKEEKDTEEEKAVKVHSATSEALVKAI